MNETQNQTVRMAITSIVHRLIMVAIGAGGLGAILSENEAMTVAAAVATLITIAISTRSSLKEKKKLLNTPPPPPPDDFSER